MKNSYNMCIRKKCRWSLCHLQKGLVHWNLCYAAMKQIKSFCGTKHPTKEQAQKYKRNMGKWIDDRKSVYACEDLAYKLIRSINLVW